MRKCRKAAALCVILAIPLLQPSVLTAEQPQQPPAPIPVQILTAKRVFVGNAGGDERPYEEPQFSGGPDRAYNEFYAEMKTWGRFELVSAPADADLIFEICFSSFEYEEVGALATRHYDPQFRLSIRDPKTSAVLWGLTEHVQWAVRQGNRDKNFEQGLARVVAEVQRIAAQSVAAGGGAK